MGFQSNGAPFKEPTLERRNDEALILSVWRGPRTARTFFDDPEQLSEAPLERPSDEHCSSFRLRASPQTFRARCANHPSPARRALTARTVAEDPEQFGEAFLERPNDEYCAWILDEQKWGGAIELSILSRCASEGLGFRV